MVQIWSLVMRCAADRMSCAARPTKSAYTRVVVCCRLSAEASAATGACADGEPAASLDDELRLGACERTRSKVLGGGGSMS